MLDLPCGLPNPLVVELPVEVGDPAAVSQRARLCALQRERAAGGVDRRGPPTVTIHAVAGAGTRSFAGWPRCLLTRARGRAASDHYTEAWRARLSSRWRRRGTLSPSRTTTTPNSARFSSSTGTRNARDVGAGHALGARGANTLGRICDGVLDRERAAGRQILVLVGGNHPERGCRPDCRGRADRGDIRAVQNGHQNRLVGAEPWPAARRGGRLHRRAWHARRRGLPVPARAAWSEPEGWRSAFASPNGWNDGVCGTVMRKLMLIPLVALSPIKPEGENPQ